MTTKGLRQGLVVSGYDEQKARGSGAASGRRCARSFCVVAKATTYKAGAATLSKALVVAVRAGI